ncbi:hypothetical protein Ais01nite_52680 [Asanoa ishikariensis]|nr:hypothetical protein Ais01nite_52680 [Asanoa ishikariensis]
MDDPPVVVGIALALGGAERPLVERHGAGSVRYDKAWDHFGHEFHLPIVTLSVGHGWDESHGPTDKPGKSVFPGPRRGATVAPAGDRSASLRCQVRGGSRDGDLVKGLLPEQQRNS